MTEIAAIGFARTLIDELPVLLWFSVCDLSDDNVGFLAGA